VVSMERHEFSLHLGHLAVLGDEILIRDPAGRSRRPGLVRDPFRQGDGQRLGIRGSFGIIQRFSVEPEDGAAFARTTGDDNPIHTEGDVVPGAMTAARPLLLPEMLLAGTRIEKARFRFRAISTYRRPLVNLYRVTPSGASTLKIEVSVRQDGAEVAEGQIQVGLDGREPSRPLEAPAPVPSAAAATAGRAPETDRVERFLRAIRIDPSSYFQGAGHVYPRGYLAALTPGALVRKFSGEGGILNALDFEFAGEALIGSSGSPTVELEDSPRIRKSFRKIIARIAEGVRTFCSGFAMVLPGESRPGLIQ